MQNWHPSRVKRSITKENISTWHLTPNDKSFSQTRLSRIALGRKRNISYQLVTPSRRRCTTTETTSSIKMTLFGVSVFRILKTASPSWERKGDLMWFRMNRHRQPLSKLSTVLLSVQSGEEKTKRRKRTVRDRCTVEWNCACTKQWHFSFVWKGSLITLHYRFDSSSLTNLFIFIFTNSIFAWLKKPPSVHLRQCGKVSVNNQNLETTPTHKTRLLTARTPDALPNPMYFLLVFLSIINAKSVFQSKVGVLFSYRSFQRKAVVSRGEFPQSICGRKSLFVN